MFSCYESTSTLPLPQIYKKVITEVITIPVSSVGYATTYYSDKNLTVPAGVEAYTYKVVDGQLQESKRYEEGDVIPQGTGVVLKAAEGSYDFEVSDEGGLVDTDNQLSGTDQATIISEPGYKYYMLSLDKNGQNVGFYWGKDSENGTKISNGAHKAYLAVPLEAATTQGSAKSSYLFGEATLISLPPGGVGGGLASLPVYDLQGRRLSTSRWADGQLKPGVYVVGGKKVVVK